MRKRTLEKRVKNLEEIVLLLVAVTNHNVAEFADLIPKIDSGEPGTVTLRRVTLGGEIYVTENSGSTTPVSSPGA